MVENFFHAETLNIKNSHSVSELFLNVLSNRGIDLDMLVNIHSDSCAVLRGKRSGALKRIGSEAPKILSTDIGGE